MCSTYSDISFDILFDRVFAALLKMIFVTISAKWYILFVQGH